MSAIAKDILRFLVRRFLCLFGFHYVENMGEVNGRTLVRCLHCGMEELRWK